MNLDRAITPSDTPSKWELERDSFEEKAKNWVSYCLSPEEVFEYWKLEDWALRNGWILPETNKTTNMSVSILEALQNANMNLDNMKFMPQLIHLVKAQLNNAVTLLEKGYSIDDEVEPLLEQYGKVEDVPEKETH